MPIKDQYPRVLIVLMTKVNADDPGNLLIRAQFGDWPKDRLAQIHGAGDPPGHDRTPDNANFSPLPRRVAA